MGSLRRVRSLLPRARIYVRRPGRDLVVILPITTNIGEQVLLVRDLFRRHSRCRPPVRLAAGMADIGIGPPGPDHHLLDGLPDLFLAAAFSGSQLPDRSVHGGLAPELRRAVIEQLEVVGV